MKRILLVALTAIATAYAVVAAGKCFDTDSLMRELEDVIEHRDEVMQEKEQRLDRLRTASMRAETEQAMFDSLGILYNEYCAYNTDSALAVAMRRKAIATQLGDSDRLANARLNTASTLVTAGLYREAMSILDSVGSKDVPDYLLPYYYHIRNSVYGLMADYTTFPPLREEYANRTKAYRDSLIAVNPPGSLAHVLALASKHKAEGKCDEAAALLTDFMESNELSDHDKAICGWAMSEVYACSGDTVAMKNMMILSAIGDMRSATREYISLRNLALVLFREGDLERAYRLLNISMEDAAACNARLRILELNDIYPQINTIYINKIRSQQRSLALMLAVISLLVLVLGVVLVRLRKQMKQIADSRRAIAEANSSLNMLNSRLSDTNESLKKANRDITENSELKEVYIGKYMDQCMSYLESMDSYRKSLMKLAAAGRNDELARTLKSPLPVEQELKSFYESFDETFLDIFPTFVEDFNKLLLPDEAIRPKRERSLTTELRIFALIRLGISDSDRIAKFLRYSLTTIYNYRTKVRNKAVGDRARLEEEVLRIGRSSHTS